MVYVRDGITIYVLQKPAHPRWTARLCGVRGTATVSAIGQSLAPASNNLELKRHACSA
jgi:hypothetical protein